MDYEPTVLDNIIIHYQFVIDLFVIMGWILAFCVMYSFILLFILAIVRGIIDLYHRLFSKTRRRYK